MNKEQAEIIALQALTYMATHEDILIAYLRLSGIAPEDLKNSAANPATLGSIIDYFLQDEKRLVALCDAENIAPDHLIKARRCLPGGEDIPYTT
ncbi:DUF3572 domain-containing protein [Paremcibacter congregatus]|uniref:DUF3572 domain-containing protein n=1 Tax=Paremcibacter congregatus TaxID=2043170 RepID=A0A2G4YMV5_9PROT|nr:DUF3572 domain-containing protein [Paremcibacter congregatus]PHZ83650.1 hypothetical protein CRD36_14820 [Paremcibacter congregatus]QDE27353.1 DUF3572 family protein [Paremcibacter congregatus]